MLPRALCENAQQVARTQWSAGRPDRVERVAPLGGFMWIDILEPCSGGPQLGGRDDGGPVQAWRGSTSQSSCASTNDARRSQEKDFQELFESDLARDTSSSSTKFDNCCLAAAVVRSIAYGEYSRARLSIAQRNSLWRHDVDEKRWRNRSHRRGHPGRVRRGRCPRR